MVYISDIARDEGETETVEVTNPATGGTVDHVEVATRGAIDRALREGRDARDFWTRTRLADRHFIYLKFVDSLRDELEDLASLLTAESGRPVRETTLDLSDAAAYFSDTIGESNAFYGRVYPHGAESITASFLQYTVNEPLGLIAVVMDDEAPALSFAYQVASTLLAGNTVVVASSPSTPLTVRRLVQLLHESGVPEQALQWVAAPDAIVEHLVGSPDIHGLNVHGDSNRAISSTAAARRNLTRVVALGHSNDAVIVFDDADLDLAAAEVARAAFSQAGQNRAATKRALVASRVRSAFTEKLLSAIERMQVGDPSLPETDVGPMISADAATRVVEEIDALRDVGVRVLAGGSASGALVQPTVLDATDDVPPALQHEVIRGPVVTIIGFDEDAEAFSLVDETPYGIGVGVFTASLQRIGSALQVAGAVIVINGAGDYRGRRIPYGGIKQSGVGTESLLATPEATTEVKTILAADIYEFSAVNANNPVGRHT